MHVTSAELDVLPSAVAAIAIIGGYLGVRSTSRNQLRLAREAYQQDRLTETYLDLLKGVHLRNAQLDDSYNRPQGKASRTPTQSDFDPTTANETLFGARLLAYASPEVDELWNKFTLLTTDFDNYLISLRRQTGVPPVSIEAGRERQRLEDMLGKWKHLRDELQAQIRKELRNPAQRRMP